jgi:hypothetical protein
MKTIRIVYLLAVLSFFAVMAGTCPAAGYQDRNDVPGHAADQHKRSFQSPGLFDGYPKSLTMKSVSGSSELPQRRFSLIEKRTDLFKVLSVLEKRISDSVLLDKVRHKLPELSQERLSMIASLSEHMEGSRRKPENDVAFLLIATLIIFS